FTRHFSSLLHPRHPPPPLFPYTTLFRSVSGAVLAAGLALRPAAADDIGKQVTCPVMGSSFKVSKSTEFRMVNGQAVYFCCGGCPDRKSTRLNSSHVKISYAVFCLKKKKP